MKSQGNTTQPNKQNKSTITNPKEMENYKLPDKEFKIVLLKLNDLQENTDRQLQRKSSKIHEQNENVQKELETIKNNKQKI